MGHLLEKLKKRSAETAEYQHQRASKEGTASPKQKIHQRDKPEKPSEKATDNQEQAENQIRSRTRDQDSTKDKKVSENKRSGQKTNRLRSAETPEIHQRVTKERISMVILGNGQSLKEALITNILGEDLSELTKRKILTNTVIYEKETFVFSCTPDLRTPCDDITELLSSYPPPDMCLLVVENGFSTECVWQQIQDLSKKTGKPTEEFRVVLPMRHKPKDYPFKSCSLELLLQELDKVAEDKKPSSTRSVLGPQLQGQLQKTGKHTDTKVNLVLLGMAGTGKSASGNTILRKKVFMSKPSSNQVTTECQVAETEINGTHVRVIDTPDIFDDDIEPSVRDKHVKRCRELCESGPSVFVLVMHVSRFTDGERDVLRKLEKAFGSKVHEHTVILFTRGDDLQEAEMSLEDFLHSCQPDLKEIIQKCGNRCVVFENHRPESEQVEKLMDTVNMMIQ